MILKRAQEEVVGFIAVVVLVVVVFLIFMSFNLNKPAEISDSTEINQFLQSSFEYTTNCAFDYDTNYANIGDLFEDCRQELSCLDGKSACDVLNNTLADMIPTALHIGVDRPRSAYSFKAVYVKTSDLGTEAAVGQSLISLMGNQNEACSKGKIGSTKALPADQGVIRVSLEAC